MSRDAEKRAQQASDRDTALSKQYGATSDSLTGQLTPIYTNWATNPQGFTDQEKNDMTTAGMQSTGGSVAGAVGQGNLQAARSGNAGGYQATLRDIARRGIAANQDEALRVKNADTMLKEAQRDSGVAGLQGLQSENQDATLKAMGLNTGAINAQTEAGKSGWFQNMLGFGKMLTDAYSAAYPGGVNGGKGGNG